MTNQLVSYRWTEITEKARKQAEECGWNPEYKGCFRNSSNYKLFKALEATYSVEIAQIVWDEATYGQFVYPVEDYESPEVQGMLWKVVIFIDLPREEKEKLEKNFTSL